MRRDRLPAHGVLAGQARAGEAPDTAPGGGTLADHAIDDAAAVELLTRAVSCPSPSGREEEVARLLVAAMSAGGAEACLDDAGNAVGVWGGGPVSVTFLGHMDTAPGTFPVRVSDGVLHGRGSVDAKGSLCAAVVAASRLSAELLDRLTLRVVGAVEEESSGSRGCRHALTTLPRPDFLIVGEPSGWDRYTLGYKGRVSARLEASRDSAHTAREDPSAAELLVDAYTALRGWVERDNLGADGAFDRLQVTLRGLVSEADGLVERSRGGAGPRRQRLTVGAGLPRRHQVVRRRAPPGGQDRDLGHERRRRELERADAGLRPGRLRTGPHPTRALGPGRVPASDRGTGARRQRARLSGAGSLTLRRSSTPGARRGAPWRGR